MLLNILLATSAILLLNSEFVDNSNVVYDTLMIKDSNYNNYLYISETNYYKITGNTYEIIPANEDSLIFTLTNPIGDEELEPYTGDIILDPNFVRRVNEQGDTIYVSFSEAGEDFDFSIVETPIITEREDNLFVWIEEDGTMFPYPTEPYSPPVSFSTILIVCFGVCIIGLLGVILWKVR